MALLVPAPVGPGDVAGPLGRGVLRGHGAGPGRRSHDEPGRIDVRGEGQARPVGRPGDLADALVRPGPDAPRRAARDGHEVQGGGRVVVGRVGPDEGHGPAVGADPRPRIADRAAGQDPRPRHGPARRPAGWRRDGRGSGCRGSSGGPRPPRRPSGARSSSSTTTIERMSAGVIGGALRRLGMGGRIAAALRFGHAHPADRDRPPAPRSGGRRRARRRHARRRPRVDAHQPRPAVPAEPRGRRRRPRRPSARAAPCRPRSRSTTGRCSSVWKPSALEALATAPAGSVRKAARPSLAVALAEGGWAATTVSATMIAAHAAGIRVFATGGIGGVHRGAVAGHVRHLVRPPGAGPDARWPSCAPDPRPSWTCRPRSSTWRRRACRC